MPFNGSGAFSAPGSDFPAVSGTLIESTKFNNVVNDIATGLTTAICKDGQTTVTANIPMAGYKFTGVGAATARTDSASLATIQDGTGVYVATVGGTADAFTLTPSPAITAYTAGQHFVFLAVGTNTTAVTCAVSGLTAKAVQINGTALAGGEIVSGKLYSIRYDGTQFQLETISITPYIATLLNDTTAAAARTTLGVPGLAANNTFTDNNTHSGIETFNKEIILVASTEVATANSLQVAGDTTIYHIAGGGTGKFILKGPGTGSSYDRFKFGENQGAIFCDASGTEPTGGFKNPGTLNCHALYDMGNRVYSSASGSLAEAVISLTANSTNATAHSLGAVPKLFQVRLRCAAASEGYSINDELEFSTKVSGLPTVSSSSGWCDATNFGAVLADELLIRNKTTFADVAVGTASWGNWRLVLRAWK